MKTRALTAEERKLVESHLRFARHSVATFVKTRPAVAHLFDDLLSAAHEGLCHAALLFDPARGVAFSTFSAFAIRSQIVDLLRGDRAGFKRSDAGPAVPLDERTLSTPSVPPSNRAEAVEGLAALASMGGKYPALADALADGESLPEAGKRIGVTKSWACRMRQKMAQRLAA